MFRYAHRSALLLALALLAGCSSNAMLRPDLTTCTYTAAGECATNALQNGDLGQPGEYRLGFVEYDDQGQLRNRAQMDAVLDGYYQLASSEDVLLIVFVHGWHHNAAVGDSNVASFRDLLRRVSRLEHDGSRQQNRQPRKVLGVYVGWRGESVEIPIINNLSFWERKNTAHDVGQQGVTELLLRLEEIVNIKRGQEQEVPPPVNSRLVVIGHSFGGAVVFTSTQKLLADRFIDSRAGKTFSGDARGFGDLVVLLNPAFEALRFATLYDLSQANCRQYFPTQLPRLAILTSETDYATKYAFPAGRIFSTLFESHITLDRHYCTGGGRPGMQAMPIAEGSADRTTVGHFQPYQTHRLLPGPAATDSKGPHALALQSSWSQQAQAATLDFDGSRLVSRGRTTPLNPYLNIKVDSELMDGHNDIWGEATVAFIRDLILISTTPQTAN